MKFLPLSPLMRFGQFLWLSQDRSIVLKNSNAMQGWIMDGNLLGSISIEPEESLNDKICQSKAIDNLLPLLPLNILHLYWVHPAVELVNVTPQLHHFLRWCHALHEWLAHRRCTLPAAMGSTFQISTRDTANPHKAQQSHHDKAQAHSY